MDRRRLILITFGVMLALFMASVEGTIVATAMPTIVSELGGLSIYSWVFSAYMLTSTTAVPIYGKLSDVFGRRPVFVAAMALFLLGSLLCGQARSMGALIAARTLQGVGAGGLMPLAFTIIGDLFSLEQRARLQGLFSGVWGVSAVIGPLLGGFLVDRISWHWVFYFNLGPGLLAGALVWVAWRDRGGAQVRGRVRIDYLGVGLLTVGAIVLLMGLFELGTPLGWGALAVGGGLLALLVRLERRAPDPLLPLPLLAANRLFAVACAHGALAGAAMFGMISYVPLFVQSVIGTSATLAGSTLTPESLAWVFTSLFSSRLLLRTSARNLALAGMALMVVGAAALLRVGPDTSQLWLMVDLVFMGAGMGLAYPAFLIAVQNAVPRAALGTATSTLQFSRSLGSTFGVSVMGAVLSARLAANLLRAGLDPSTISLDALLDPLANASASALEDTLRVALAGAIHDIFIVALLISALALLIAARAPRERLEAAPADAAGPA